MARRKISMRRIVDNSKRHTAFTKRRQGLMKKTKDYFNRNQTEGAVVVFSDAGNGFVYAKPDLVDVLDRYNAANSSALEEEAGAGVEEEEEEEAETEAQRRIGEAVESGKWEETMENLGVEELDEMYAEMERIRREVAAERERRTAAEEDSPAGPSSVGKID